MDDLNDQLFNVKSEWLSLIRIMISHNFFSLFIFGKKVWIQLEASKSIHIISISNNVCYLNRDIPQPLAESHSRSVISCSENPAVPKIKQFINLNWNLVWLNRAKFDPHTLLCNFKPPGQPVVGRFPLSRIVSSKFNICSYILLQTPYRPSTTWYGKTRKTRHPSWRLHLTHKPAAATHLHLHTRFSSLFLHHRRKSIFNHSDNEGNSVTI